MPRRLIPALLTACLLGAGLRPASAAPELPADLTARQAAVHVVTAFDAGDRDTVRRIAQRDLPEPWEVLRYVLGTARYDIARAFAEDVGDVRRGEMYAEVDAWKADPEPKAIQAAFEAVDRSDAKGAFIRERMAAITPRTLSAKALKAYHLQVAAARDRKYDLRFELLSAAVARLAEAGWHSRQSWCHWMRGGYFQRARKYAEAVAEFQLGIEAAARARRYDHGGVSSLALAYTQLRLGDTRAALKAAEQSRTLHEKAGDRREQARVWNALNRIHDRLGAYEDALVAARNAVRLSRALGNRRLVALNMGNVGRTLKDLGRLEEAQRVLEEALRLTEDPAAAALRPDNMRLLAHVFRRRADHSRAIKLYRESLRLVRRTGSKRRIGWTLHALATAMLAIGEYEQAVQLLEESIELKRETGQDMDRARSMTMLAAAYHEMERYEEALALHQHAFRVKKRLGDERGLTNTLMQLSSTLQKLGKLEEAERSITRGLEMKRKTNDPILLAYGLAQLGDIQIERGKHDEAMVAFRKALELAEATGLANPLLFVHNKMAKAHLARGEPKEAMDQARRTITHLRTASAGLDVDEAASFREANREITQHGLRAAIALEDLDSVFAFLELARSAGVLSAVGGREGVGAAALPKDLVDAERKAAGAVRQARQALVLALGAGDRTRQAQAQQALAAAELELKQVVARMKAGAPVAADAIYPEPLPLGEVQQRMPAKSALVLYELDKALAYALVITRGQARLMPLGPTEAITEAVSRVKLDTPPVLNTKGLAAVRDLVITPLGLPKDTTQLLLSPSGALGRLPFCALVPERRIAYVASATTYLLMKKGCTRCGKGVLAVGDPLYPAKADGNGLRRLPYTADEAKVVGDVVLLGKDATEPALVHALATRGKWSALHLACHGLVDVERPRRSALALTPGTQGDGRLTVHEVFRMRIPADMVVLSACETGKASKKSADGIAGFTRAFMYAGSSRVLVSLWRVDDEATSALMKKLYELWKPSDAEPAMTTAEALQRAQAWMRTQKRWKHPYYWSAWSLWGVAE